MKIRCRERDIAQRGNLECAVDPEALRDSDGIAIGVDFESRRRRAWKQPACERQLTERVAGPDTEVIVRWPHADVVETFVDDIPVAIAHPPVRGGARATRRAEAAVSSFLSWQFRPRVLVGPRGGSLKR